MAHQQYFVKIDAGSQTAGRDGVFKTHHIFLLRRFGVCKTLAGISNTEILGFVFLPIRSFLFLLSNDSVLNVMHISWMCKNSQCLVVVIIQRQKKFRDWDAELQTHIMSNLQQATQYNGLPTNRLLGFKVKIFVGLYQEKLSPHEHCLALQHVAQRCWAEILWRVFRPSCIMP